MKGRIRIAVTQSTVIHSYTTQSCSTLFLFCRFLLITKQPNI